jgi:hypothetical protein
MNLVHKFLEWDERTYASYFRESAYKNTWFAFATFFFAFAVAHGIWILRNYWETIPSAMQWTFVSALILTLLPWVRALQQHSRIRGLLKNARSNDLEIEMKFLKEAASGTLFVLWIAYVTLNLLFEILLHFSYLSRWATVGPGGG